MLTLGILLVSLAVAAGSAGGAIALWVDLRHSRPALPPYIIRRSGGVTYAIPRQRGTHA